MMDKNLLVIISDEHRRDAMGCTGHPIVKTPNLDALARQGTRFERAYTASPMCVPTRAALATGTYIHQNRCWDSATAYDGGVPSWMHILRDKGFETTSIGKLHFRSGEDDNGFEREILPMHIFEKKGWLIGLLRRNPPPFDGARELAAEVGSGASEYTDYDRRVTDAAEEWLSDPARKKRPFAGFISLVSPHYPLIAPDEFYRLYDPAEMPVPNTTIPDHDEVQRIARFFDYHRYFDNNSARKAIAAYYGLTSFMDDCVGRVITALDQAGLGDDTLVIYTSDHGELLGDHGLWTKQVMYESSVGIPLVVRGADIPQNKVSQSGAHLLDIPATALAVSKTEKPSDWPGINLTSLAKAPDDASRPLFSEYHDGGSTTGIFMLAWGEWKLVWYAGGLAPQLFNLSTDPSESKDLAADDHYKDVLAMGKKLLWNICDPEKVSAEAFADQEAKIASLGGVKACREAFVFNATPAPLE